MKLPPFGTVANPISPCPRRLHILISQINVNILVTLHKFSSLPIFKLRGPHALGQLYKTKFASYAVHAHIGHETMVSVPILHGPSGWGGSGAADRRSFPTRFGDIHEE
jgi:hypothetical protein